MVKGKGTGRETIMKSSTKGVTKSQDTGASAEKHGKLQAICGFGCEQHSRKED